MRAFVFSRRDSDDGIVGGNSQAIEIVGMKSQTIEIVFSFCSLSRFSR